MIGIAMPVLKNERAKFLWVLFRFMVVVTMTIINITTIIRFLSKSETLMSTSSTFLLYYITLHIQHRHTNNIERMR